MGNPHRIAWESLLLHFKNMEVIRDLGQVKSLLNPVVTIGTFDGVHLGHLSLLKRIVSIAKDQNIKSILFTFDPHPRTVVQNEDVKLLSPTSEKIQLLERLGLDYLLIIPFTKAFASLSASEFIKTYFLDTLKIGEIVIGYDHQFGNNREGNIDFLRKTLEGKKIKITEIPAEEINDIKISSSKIRKALLEGRINEANSLLGYQYMLKGLVVKGKQLGKTIGFPTANIQISENEKLIPGNGVYAVQIIVRGNDYFGMMNIGVKPTINENEVRTIEVNIFDFNSEIYGETIKIIFCHKFRDEIKFPNLKQLKDQLKLDENTIRTFFNMV